MKTSLHVYTVVVKDEAGREVARYDHAARHRNYADALEAAKDRGHDPVDVWDEPHRGHCLVVITRGGRIRVR